MPTAPPTLPHSETTTATTAGSVAPVTGPKHQHPQPQATGCTDATLPPPPLTQQGSGAHHHLHFQPPAPPSSVPAASQQAPSTQTQKEQPPPAFGFAVSDEPVSRRPLEALSIQLMALLKQITHKKVQAQRIEKGLEISGGGPLLNGGYDDKEGHYVVIAGEEVAGRYVVQQVLGKGSFGIVVRAIDLKTQEQVAVKISRSGSYFINQAKLEVDVLIRVNRNQRLSHLTVHLRKYLMWQGHAVLVFQLLSLNLYQLIKLSKHNGVSLDLTRKFACQILQVLVELERSDPPIIHCDLKPENILLYDQSRSGIRVIDFGSACFDAPHAHKHRYIQSRFYRSPEVILGLPYGTAIDRWSLGCILVEMHTGAPIFPGRSEAEQLARMEALLGPAPESLIAAASKREQFYQPAASALGGASAGGGRGGGGGVSTTLLKPPLPTYATTLHDIVGTTIGGPRGNRKGQPGHTEQHYRVFVDFVLRLLAYDPSQRMSCAQAMGHPFIAPLMQQQQQAVAAQQQQQQAQQAQQQQLSTSKGGAAGTQSYSEA